MNELTMVINQINGLRQMVSALDIRLKQIEEVFEVEATRERALSWAAERRRSATAPEDSWTERISRFLDSWSGNDVSVMQVLDGLGLQLDRQGQAESTRAARALTALGWERYRPRVEGARVWRYHKPYIAG